MQIKRYHLNFLDECIATFEKEPLRETHMNKDSSLIGLRYGLSRDCVRIFELDGEVAFFANVMKKTPLFFSTEREEVRWFAGLMEGQLRANDHKGGWHSMTKFQLHERLEEEVKELEQAILGGGHSERIIREASDVANFAMMIADKERNR